MLINLLILQIITFIGVVLLLRFIFTRHLKSALSRLNALHGENLSKEEELKEEIRRVKEQSEAFIKQSREEAELIIAEANKNAQRIRMNIEEQARNQAEKIISDSRIDSEKIQKEALKNIQGQSIELALRMISELLTETDKVALQYELANGIIEEISRLPKEQFSVPGGEVNITSSFPLLERQCNKIKSILTDKSGSPVNLNQKLDPEIIGGLIVEMGGMVIDGTLRSRLQRVAEGFK